MSAGVEGFRPRRDPSLWHRISNRNEVDLLGDCSVCGPNVSLVQYFYKSGTRPTAWGCRAAQYKRNTDTYHRRQLKHRFGLPNGEYERMLKKQNGVCAICHRVCNLGRRLAVDHCHASGLIRGLLCSDCNTSLGKFHDRTDWLQNAIDYLNDPPSQEYFYSAHTAPPPGIGPGSAG